MSADGRNVSTELNAACGTSPSIANMRLQTRDQSGGHLISADIGRRALGRAAWNRRCIFSAANPPSATVPAAPRDTGAATNPKIQKIDEDFVKNAARANQAEIKLGQLAVQKGSTLQIRQMGLMMIDDHRQVGERLQSIATRAGFTLPTQLSSDQQAAYDRLSAMNGKEFDDAYLDQMKSDHQQAISLFQNEANNGINLELRQFAQTTLSSLQKHQQMVSRSSQKM